MPAWTRISVIVPTSATELVENLLLEFGAASVTLQAADDEELFAEHGGDAPLWQRCRVEGLFDTAVDCEAVAASVEHLVSTARVLTPGSLADADWEVAFKQYAVDRLFNDRLRLAPRGTPTCTGAITLQLDPGLAFGSGSHATTRLCLEWIARCELAGRSALDFGCGSGVLGIAMAMLGARKVVSVDVDVQALCATRENAEHNGISADQLETVETADFQLLEEGYHVVVANILLQPLVELAPLLVSTLAPGGTLVLSGVLDNQREALLAAYPRIRFHDIVNDEGWLLLAGQRD